ncbi:MAG: exosortase [Candidatus Thiodiazotropha sp. (ex Epidulcina cf. delphinae)]|nr:exosortase [Candidatus Thiodiazotropha sp. (ex Epidulcina cf. delphinae)]
MATFYIYSECTLHLLELWTDWPTGEYSHGLLVLFVSIYLIWEQRKSITTEIPSTNYYALILLIFSHSMWFSATLVDVLLIQILSLLFTLTAISWALLGTPVFRLIFYQFFLLIFALPVWLPLQYPLQTLTTHVVHFFLSVAEIPVYKSGYFLNLPNGAFEVAPGCSGLRYFLVALYIGCLLAFIYYRSNIKRVIVLAVAVLLAVTANILRVFTVVVFGYLTDMQHHLVHSHQNLGWFIFAIIITPLIYIASRYSDMQNRHDDA